MIIKMLKIILISIIFFYTNINASEYNQKGNYMYELKNYINEYKQEIKRINKFPVIENEKNINNSDSYKFIDTNSNFVSIYMPNAKIIQIKVAPAYDLFYEWEYIFDDDENIIEKNRYFLRNINYFSDPIEITIYNKDGSIKSTDNYYSNFIFKIEEDRKSVV